MNKKNYIPSFLTAYLISIDALNQIMGIAVKSSDGLMVMNLIPVAGLILLHFFISNKQQDLNLDKKALLFVYYIVSVIILYKRTAIYSTLSYTETFVYCFIPIYISFYKVSVEKILKITLILSLLVLPVANDFFRDVGRSDFETIGMPTTYNVLPFVVAAVLHFFYYRKNNSFFNWILYSVNAYYLLKVVLLGNRGPIVSLIVLVVLVIMHKTDGEMVKKNTKKTVFLTLLVGIGTILLVNNIETVIIELYKLFESINIKIAPLAKSVMQINRGDLSNGRAQLFEFTVKGIKDNIWLGNGIDSMLYKSMGTESYPHNLFLHMWYDLGIFVSIPLFFVVLKTAKNTFFATGISKHRMVLWMFLFVLSVPKLCYSSDFWKTIPFWFLIMNVISPNIYEESYLNTEETMENENEGFN